MHQLRSVRILKVNICYNKIVSGVIFAQEHLKD